MLRCAFAFATVVGCAAVANADIVTVPGEYLTIQSAIDHAEDGDEIVVSLGVYFETIDLSGKAVTLRSAAGPLNTIIDADGAAASVVKCVNGEGPDTVIEGFTLTAGKGTHQGAFRKGGGMYNYMSSPTVRNCVFAENIVSAYGNDVYGAGAGMYNEVANPAVIGCTFRDNELRGCSGWLYGGGGMYNNHSSPTISDSKFIANIAYNGGGMMSLNDSHPTAINSEFTMNHADFSGGGVNVTEGSTTTLVNSCVINNRAFHGAGVYATGSRMTLLNSTLSGNHATKTGGGVYVMYGPTPTEITNSIVWGNLADEFPADKEIARRGGAHPDVVYCTVQGGYAGEGNSDRDPAFVNPDNDDYTLDEASGAINAGDTAAYDGPDTDLAGNPRVLNNIDMGSYEFQEGTTSCDADITGDDVVNFRDVLAVLVVWGPCSGCPEDLDGDGQVGSNDVLQVVAAWGPCP